MSSGLGLDGKMIPRRVKRIFDQREEQRGDAHGSLARLVWRDQTLDVRVDNISSSGAMLVCDEIPNIGEKVTLEFNERSAAAGDVCWVRDGRIGIYFAAPLE